jgi:hypothetical protein
MRVVDAGIPYLKLTFGGLEYFLQAGKVVNERGEPYQPIPPEVVTAMNTIDPAQLAALGFAERALGVKLTIRSDSYFLRGGRVYSATGTEWRAIPAAVSAEILRMDPAVRAAAGF